MKIDELMIGDIVFHEKYGNAIIEANDNDFGDNPSVKLISENIKHKDGYKYGYCWCDLDEIFPIPLTPEILEKNGFTTEEREGDPTFPYLAFIIENDEYRIEITWYDSHDVYEPNTGEYLHGAPEVWNMEILGRYGNYDFGKNKLYIHELQHALKLCGIGIEINL